MTTVNPPAVIDEYKRIATRSSRFTRSQSMARSNSSLAPKTHQPASKSEPAVKSEAPAAGNAVSQNQKTEVRRELHSAEEREVQKNEQIQRQTLKTEEDRVPVVKEEARAASSKTAIIGVNLDVQA